MIDARESLFEGIDPTEIQYRLRIKYSSCFSFGRAITWRKVVANGYQNPSKLQVMGKSEHSLA
jgi:hypothetical protein